MHVEPPGIQEKIECSHRIKIFLVRVDELDKVQYTAAVEPSCALIEPPFHILASRNQAPPNPSGFCCCKAPIEKIRAEPVVFAEGSHINHAYFKAESLSYCIHRVVTQNRGII